MDHSSTIVTGIPNSVQLNPSIGSHSLQQQLLRLQLTLTGYCVLLYKKAAAAAK
jgi:hypothetical protein